MRLGIWHTQEIGCKYALYGDASIISYAKKTPLRFKCGIEWRSHPATYFVKA